MKPNGSMPHDTADARTEVLISKASSRRELARLVVSEIIPELQRLAGNDKVTQDVCKAIMAAAKAQTEEA